MRFKRPAPKFVDRKNKPTIEIREKRMLNKFKSGEIPETFVWFYETHFYMKKVCNQKKAYSIFISIFEKIVISILMIPLSPLFLLISLVIYLSERGPVFFKSPRLGQYGIPFHQIKFRTMRMGAKETTSEYNKVHVDCPNKFMLFLRNHKIDELPNLFNVLRGEMSIIGPRPIGPDEHEFTMKDGFCLYRLATKPGITGLWQTTSTKLVSGRKRLFRDTIYVANRGPLLDLKIIFLTFRVLFKGEKKIIAEKHFKHEAIKIKAA